MQKLFDKFLNVSGPDWEFILSYYTDIAMSKQTYSSLNRVANILIFTLQYSPQGM